MVGEGEKGEAGGLEGIREEGWLKAKEEGEEGGQGVAVFHRIVGTGYGSTERQKDTLHTDTNTRSTT